MNRELNFTALGERVKFEREKKHLTQEQLGEICGLSTSYIGHIERGSRKLSLETLYKISSALDVSLDYLVFDSLDSDKNLFNNIDAMLKDKDPAKVRTFITTVRILAEKIDEY